MWQFFEFWNKNYGFINNGFVALFLACLATMATKAKKNKLLKNLLLFICFGNRVKLDGHEF